MEEKVLERIINKLIDHDERFNRVEERMATREDIRAIMDTLEGIASVTKHTQEELAFAVAWIKRLQTTSDVHDNEIHRLKIKIGLA